MIEALSSYQQRNNQQLDQWLNRIPFQTLPLIEAMRYGLLLGGKRARPYLVYITGQMLGCELSDLDTPASAVECIHAYSLIHDDLPAMDDDELRRGKPTCHIQFDEATAILSATPCKPWRLLFWRKAIFLLQAKHSASPCSKLLPKLLAHKACALVKR